ncbi:MAG: ABC transporter ATP-binding protein [Acidobacteria bacterium]|nr:ABC transporter ATP-binding protein [Acidobacteriota bacterium]
MEEQVQGKLYDGRLMRRLLRYLRPYWMNVALALVCMLGTAAVEVSGPLLTRLAIDKYLAPQGSPLVSWLDPYLSSDALSGLTQISALFLLTLVLALVFEFTQTYLMTMTGQKAIADLRRDSMAHLQRLDISYYDQTPVGRMLTRVTSDTDALTEMLTSGLVTLIGDIVTLSLILIVMLRMSVPLTLVILSAMPMVVIVAMRFRRDVASSNRRIRTAVARINSYLQEHLTGIGVLQLFNRESRSKQEFDGVNGEHRDAFKDAVTAYGWFYPAVEFCGTVTVALLLGWGGYQVRDGALTAGVLVAFFQYGIRFFKPIQDLSEKYNILQSAVAAAERIFHLLDTPVRIQSAATAEVPADGVVEFDHVWFAYKGEDWILRDVSFRIEPGETIAVVGHTGAGKTTLTNLLLRFYDIQKGAIRVGGVDIRQMELDALRRRFAVVLQDPFLMTGTLADNIRLGSAHVTEDAAGRAVEQVNLGEYVRALPDGLGHAVRERGAGISTGQKQLISFARALAHDPRFLILDEATSSVDTDTELRIRTALDALVEGRTSLIIAHRLSTIQRANRIFVMHKGQLREVGTHQQLLAARGIYYKLYQLQYSEQERLVR